MSGTTPPVIHRVSALDLAVEAWTWPFAEARRAEIDGAFRRQAARKAGDVERPRPARAQPGVCRRPLQRQLFRNRFRKLSGLARLGLSRHRPCSTVSAWARCAAPTAPSCSARWASTRRTPGASIFPPARPISTTSGTARSTYQAASRASSRRRPALRPANIESEPDWHCIYTGPAVAMIRMLHVDMPGEALRDRIEANLALQRSAGIIRHPSRARHARSHLGNAALCHGVHRGAVRVPTLTCRLAGFERPARCGRKQCA